MVYRAGSQGVMVAVVALLGAQTASGQEVIDLDEIAAREQSADAAVDPDPPVAVDTPSERASLAQVAAYLAHRHAQPGRTWRNPALRYWRWRGFGR